MAENTQSVLERTAADQWKVLPSGLTVLVRPMPGYSGTHVIYATRFGSIDRDFRLGEREVHLPEPTDACATIHKDTPCAWKP